MSAGFAAVHLDTLESLEPPYDNVPPRWLPLRSLLGVTGFGVNAWTAVDAGDWVIEPHDEDDHEELYLFLRGAADMRVGTEGFSVRAGSVVFVANPSLHREARATQPGTTVFVVGGVKGTLTPSEWETRWLSGATPAPE